MPKSDNQSLKLLYIKDIFLKKTNEEHPITVEEIINELASRDILAARRSIYDDIKRLCDYGLTIKSVRRGQYYVPEEKKDFTDIEMRMLADLVNATRGIPEIKTSEDRKPLAERLAEMTSDYTQKMMKNNALLFNQEAPKTASNVYDIMRDIYEAINKNSQLEFDYLVYDTKGRLVSKHSGKKTVVSPYVVTWDNGNCYLLAYSKDTSGDAPQDMIKIYRCDKIGEHRVLNIRREGMDFAKKRITHDYLASVFSMFDGERIFVEVIFENRLSNVVFDRFGKDVTAYPCDKEHFKANLRVAYSPQFLGWLLGLGGGYTLTGVNAEKILEDMKKLIPSIK